MKQFEVYLINLDPIIGNEISKTRPCIIISPNEMNLHVQTVIIAPMTTKSHPYPTRIHTKFLRKNAWVMLDQIRTVDKKRLIKKLGNLKTETISLIKNTLKEMLVE